MLELVTHSGNNANDEDNDYDDFDDKIVMNVIKTNTLSLSLLCDATDGCIQLP